MFKKALSLLLSLMLLVTSLSAAAVSTFAADTATYVVAGTANLCGVEWKGNSEESPDCVMTAKDDGTYEKVFANVAPTSDVQIKVVENTADGKQNWIGDSTGNNITFDVTVACDVTVTFNPATQEITVTGDGVAFKTELAIDSMYAVGNAADETDPWLNGVTWQPDAEVNKMTEVSDNVYEIVFKNVEGPFEAYQVKFAANGTWTDSWGGVFAESGVAFDAEYNGDNIAVSVPYALADVKLTLDLNGFDYATKTGGKITVDITEVVGTTEATESTEPTAEGPKDEPTTAVATEAPAAALTVKSTSNLFAETVQKFDADTKQVTVTYFFESEKDVLNAQWALTYDPNVLKVTPKNNLNGNPTPCYMPICGANGVVYNASIAGKVNANASSLSLYPFKDGRKAFVSVTFDVIGEGETTVDLNVDVLTLGELNEDTFQADAEKQYKVIKGGVVQEEGYALLSNLDNAVYAGGYNPDAVKPPVSEDTTPSITTETPSEEVPTVVVPGFKVTGTSNLFPTTVQQFNSGTKQLTVTYFFESEKDMLNAQWSLKYDPNVLEVNPNNNTNGHSTPSYMPVCGTNGAVYNVLTAEDKKEVNGNASSLSLYPFKDGRKAFVSVTFDVLAEVDTTVDLSVDVLTLCELNEDTFQADSNKQVKVVKGGEVNEAGYALLSNTDTVIYEGLFNPDATNTPVEPSKELTVIGKSNFFPETKQVIAESEKNVTVTYFFESAKALLNAQWELVYDPSVLTINPENNSNVMPMIDGGSVINLAESGKAYGNFSNLSLYNFDAKAPFVTVVFDKAEGATGETTVDLQVLTMTLSQLNPATGESDEAAEETIVKNSTIYSSATKYTTDTVVSPGIVVPDIPTEPITSSDPIESTPPTEQRETLPAPDPDKFFVVAGDEALCGSNWNPADRNNEMKFNPATGLYEMRYFDVAANTYNFKVTTNGAWDNGDFNLEGDAMFGGPNATVTVPEDGSVVIISFNGQKAFVDVYGPGVEFPTFPEEVTVPPSSSVPESSVPESSVPESSVPESSVPESSVPESSVPESSVPTTEPTDVTVPSTTATDATSATGATVNGGSTADTPSQQGGSSSKAPVKTGSASMAVVILLVLVSGTGAIYFTRKRVR